MRQVFWYLPLFAINVMRGKVRRTGFIRLSVSTGPQWMRERAYLSGFASLLWFMRYQPQEQMRHAKKMREFARNYEMRRAHTSPSILLPHAQERAIHQQIIKSRKVML